MQLAQNRRVKTVIQKMYAFRQHLILSNFFEKIDHFCPLKVLMSKSCTNGANYIESEAQFFKTDLVQKVTCLSA